MSSKENSQKPISAKEPLAKLNKWTTVVAILVSIALTLIANHIAWADVWRRFLAFVQPWGFQMLLTGICLLIGRLLFWYRKRHRTYFGICEVAFGCVVVWTSVVQLAIRHDPAILIGLAGGLFLMVRGFDNIEQGNQAEMRGSLMQWVLSRLTLPTIPEPPLTTEQEKVLSAMKEPAFDSLPPDRRTLHALEQKAGRPTGGIKSVVDELRDLLLADYRRKGEYVYDVHATPSPYRKTL